MNEKQEEISVGTGRPVSTVRVYCGNFVGAAHWHGLEVYEPDECDWEGWVPIPEAPEERDLGSFVCGGCGAVNAIRDHEVGADHDTPAGFTQAAERPPKDSAPSASRKGE